jgi:hypothetical protein
MRSSQPRNESQILAQSDVRGLATTVLSILLGSEAPQKRVTQQMLLDTIAQFDGPIGSPGSSARLLCSGQRLAEAIAGALGLTILQPGGPRGSLLTRAQPFNETSYQAPDVVVVHSPLAIAQASATDAKASSFLRRAPQNTTYDTPSSYSAALLSSSDADRKRRASFANQSKLEEFWNEFCSALFVED